MIDALFWSGWWDSPFEGTFTDVNNDDITLEDTLGFLPWYYGEPNGDTLENCAVVWPSRNAWNDIDCAFKTCSFCELDRAPDLQIRGRK